MPISPERKKLYPPNWEEIRERILKRADNKCELCGVPNHQFIIRLEGASWMSDIPEWPNEYRVKIVLTVHHLDFNPENNEDWNLMALCQRCHNILDCRWRRRKKCSRST
jgi:5-methylcytosine-specific restriction endonuclease McrA